MTIHRPDFATITLANDLRKLEEDWLRLEQRATRPTAIDLGSDLSRTLMLGTWRIQCTITRTNLVEGSISFDCAKTIRDMLEAAFDVARRALNGIDPDQPIPYTLTSTPPLTLVTRDEPAVDEVPC